MRLKFRKLKGGKADSEFRSNTLGIYFSDVLLTIYETKKKLHFLKALKQVPLKVVHARRHFSMECFKI